jgi:hypothetical protein
MSPNKYNEFNMYHSAHLGRFIAHQGDGIIPRYAMQHVYVIWRHHIMGGLGVGSMHFKNVHLKKNKSLTFYHTRSSDIRIWCSWIDQYQRKIHDLWNGGFFPNHITHVTGYYGLETLSLSWSPKFKSNSLQESVWCKDWRGLSWHKIWFRPVTMVVLNEERTKHPFLHGDTVDCLSWSQIATNSEHGHGSVLEMGIAKQALFLSLSRLAPYFAQYNVPKTLMAFSAEYSFLQHGHKANLGC